MNFQHVMAMWPPWLPGDDLVLVTTNKQPYLDHYYHMMTISLSVVSVGM